MPISTKNKDKKNIQPDRQISEERRYAWVLNMLTQSCKQLKCKSFSQFLCPKTICWGATTAGESMRITLEKNWKVIVFGMRKFDLIGPKHDFKRLYLDLEMSK